MHTLFFFLFLPISVFALLLKPDAHPSLSLLIQYQDKLSSNYLKSHVSFVTMNRHPGHGSRRVRHHLYRHAHLWHFPSLAALAERHASGDHAGEEDACQVGVVARIAAWNRTGRWSCDRTSLEGLEESAEAARRRVRDYIGDVTRGTMLLLHLIDTYLLHAALRYAGTLVWLERENR